MSRSIILQSKKEKRKLIHVLHVFWLSSSMLCMCSAHSNTNTAQPEWQEQPQEWECKCLTTEQNRTEWNKFLFSSFCVGQVKHTNIFYSRMCESLTTDWLTDWLRERIPDVHVCEWIWICRSIVTNVSIEVSVIVSWQNEIRGQKEMICGPIDGNQQTIDNVWVWIETEYAESISDVFILQYSCISFWRLLRVCRIYVCPRVCVWERENFVLRLICIQEQTFIN